MTQLAIDLLGDPAEDMLRTAWLSDDKVYRWTLHRTWGSPANPAVFVMLNPSTADATEDDPTIRRCIGFARAWGHSALVVVNLYALRSTDPKGLWVHPDPVGRGNDRFIRGAIERAGIVVAAWGNNARPDRVEAFRRLTDALGVTVHTLGATLSGAPKHPLARGHHRVPDDVIPTPYTFPPRPA